MKGIENRSYKYKISIENCLTTFASRYIRLRIVQKYWISLMNVLDPKSPLPRNPIQLAYPIFLYNSFALLSILI